MKTFVLYFLLFVCSYAFAGHEDEEFYIFDVGQGNSQLVIYKQAKLGFLYDAGSSSRQKHPKLTGLSKEDWSVFLTNKPVPQINLADLDFGIEEEVKKEAPRKLSGGSGSSGSHTMSLKESEEIEDIEKSIKSTIEASNLNWLIMFLSHPDKDHINLVNSKSIPSTLKVIAFLGGDFLGTESETEVNKVLEFFRTRNPLHTWVELPFYWGWNDPNGGFKNYSNIRTHFLTEDINPEARKEIRNLSLSQYNPEEFFHGSAWDLLTKITQKDITFYDFAEYNPYTPDYNLPQNSLGKDLSKKVLSGNALIWAMNHRLYDVNAQSSVISFKLPENNTRLICTGDAEDSTFWRIQKELTARKITIPNRPEGRENILMVPHHGSKNNISDLMLGIFQPTLFVISAGNGKQYGHPDLETITWLRQHQSNKSWISKEYEPKFIGFKKDKKITTAYLKNSIKHDSCPILSTNFLGTLRFNQKELSSLFNSIFEINQATYKVDFLTNIPLTNPVFLEESDCLYQENEKYYFKVLNKNNDPLYYLMKLIE